MDDAAEVRGPALWKKMSRSPSNSANLSSFRDRSDVRRQRLQRMRESFEVEKSMLAEDY